MNGTIHDIGTSKTQSHGTCKLLDKGVIRILIQGTIDGWQGLRQCTSHTDVVRGAANDTGPGASQGLCAGSKDFVKVRNGAIGTAFMSALSTKGYLLREFPAFTSSSGDVISISAPLSSCSS